MYQWLVENCHLEPWDWLSFVLALVAFVVAYKTFISQRKTEKNTTPRINKEIQEFLLNNLLIDSLEGFLELSFLRKILKEKNYGFYPSEEILEGLKIDTGSIHLDLYFEEVKQFRCLEGLYKTFQNYNNRLDSLNRYLRDLQVPSDFLDTSFKKLIALNEEMADQWSMVMRLVYGYDEKRIVSIYESIVPSDPDPQGNASSRFSQTISPSNAYARMLESDPPVKDVFLAFMDCYLEASEEDIISSLIPKA